MIDFHTHILPSMDDGSKDVKTSIELLNILKDEGVKTVCLTPHFYPSKESVDSFIYRRNNAYKQLNYKDLDLLLGAEIHYYRGISTNEDLRKLCLANTNILLIELSFNNEINDNVINELVNIINKGYRVVLAHIERYEISDITIEYMHSKGIMMQVNTEMFLSFFSSRKALKWLSRGLIDFIGSDCHNLQTRKPNYRKAIDVIEKKLGKEYLGNFTLKNSKIVK